MISGGTLRRGQRLGAAGISVASGKSNWILYDFDWAQRLKRPPDAEPSPRAA